MILIWFVLITILINLNKVFENQFKLTIEQEKSLSHLIDSTLLTSKYSKDVIGTYYRTLNLKNRLDYKVITISDIARWFRDEKLAFIDIKPIDNWTCWIYQILEADFMCPFFISKDFDESSELNLITYEDAEYHAISWLLSDEKLNKFLTKD